MPQYSLLLCPHPDDLVFSAFSAIVRRKSKLALVYFNVSNFTRWRLKSKILVSALRTFEDKVIMSSLGTKTSYLFLEDTSAAGFGSHSSSAMKKEMIPGEESIIIKKNSASFPEEIFLPLGIGKNPNHLFVRKRGIDLYFSLFERKPKLFFYEDLPYAARGPPCKELLDELFSIFKTITPVLSPLTPNEMRKKILTSRAYLSQNNHSALLTQHARELGHGVKEGFAERYYLVAQ